MEISPEIHNLHTHLLHTTTRGNKHFLIFVPKILPLPKNLAIPVMGPISFKVEQYFNDLLPN